MDGIRPSPYDPQWPWRVVFPRAGGARILLRSLADLRRTVFSMHENTFLKIDFIRKVFFILSNKQVFFCAQNNQNAGGLRRPPEPPQTLLVRGTRVRVRTQCRFFPRRVGAACPSMEWSSGLWGIVKGEKGASKCPLLLLNARVPAPVARRN